MMNEHPEHSPEDQRRRTLHAIHCSGLNVQNVWIRYFSLTGNVSEFEIDAYLNGAITLTALDPDLVSHAVNELITETPPPPAAPYSDHSEDPGVMAALSGQENRDILDGLGNADDMDEVDEVDDGSTGAGEGSGQGT
ncbi:hypothetical protein [Arthrobacter pityocampae]|uniref:hypothetical protein n=1 Tax=Arthrobacter pityocampae TaxID=547334 RepID=UPI003735B0E1